MKRTTATVLLSLSLATVCEATPDRFAVDRSSPLKPAKSGKKDDGNVVRFTGNARLSGRFVIAWELANKRPSHLRVLFFPDAATAPLLPHVVREPLVTELLITNREQAVSMLVQDPESARRLLAGEQLKAEGEATVRIGNYRTSIDCDHRWYLAELMSVARVGQIAEAVARASRLGC